MFLKCCWYAAARSHEIGRDLLGRVLLNEPVVLYRKEDGTPVALEDRCAHRRVQLSMGRLIGDQLQCRYHGLVYDASGVCTRVPGQKQFSADIRVKSYPAVERHTFIWIWMGDPALADESQIPNFHYLDDASWLQSGDYFYVPANYLLIIDNLCDLSHVAYLHSSYTGNEPVGELAAVKTERIKEQEQEAIRGQRWTFNVEPAQTYATFGHYKGNIDRWQKYEFNPPGFFKINNGSAVTGTGASEENPEGGAGRWQFRVYHAITPETEKSSHYYWVVMHQTGINDPEVRGQFDRQMHSILTEDFEVFVNQQRNIDLDPSAPTKAITADSGLIQARMIIDRMLQQEAQTMTKRADQPVRQESRSLI